MTEETKQEQQTQIAAETTNNESVESTSVQPQAPEATNAQNLDKTQKSADKAKKKDEKVKPVKTESIAWKCEQFFGKNWKYIASFIAIAMLVNACQISDIGSRMSQLEKTVADNNGKVVLTTTDGRAIRVTKEPLKAEFLKQTAASSLVNNLIVDRRTITNEFNTMTFKSPEEVLNSVQKLGSFFLNYIDQNDPQAIGNLRGYLQWLISAIARDELPEFISIKNYTIDKYTYVGNTFEMEITITAIAQSYIINANKYISHSSVMRISTKGTFDLANATDENPYGLRYSTLQIIPIKKVRVR